MGAIAEIFRNSRDHYLEKYPHLPANHRKVIRARSRDVEPQKAAV